MYTCCTRCVHWFANRVIPSHTLCASRCNDGTHTIMDDGDRIQICLVTATVCRASVLEQNSTWVGLFSVTVLAQTPFVSCYLLALRGKDYIPTVCHTSLRPVALHNHFAHLPCYTYLLFFIAGLILGASLRLFVHILAITGNACLRHCRSHCISSRISLPRSLRAHRRARKRKHKVRTSPIVIAIKVPGGIRLPCRRARSARYCRAKIRDNNRYPILHSLLSLCSI